MLEPPKPNDSGSDKPPKGAAPEKPPAEVPAATTPEESAAKVPTATEPRGAAGTPESLIELDALAEPKSEAEPTKRDSRGTPVPPHLELIDRQRENVRGQIAKALILILGIIVVSSFVSLWANIGIANGQLKDLLSTILGPVAALVGSATGFYFGGKADSGTTPTAPTSPATPSTKS